MDSNIDVERLVEEIRTQSKDAPGSDTDRVTIRSFERVDGEMLAELKAALESDTPGAADLSFHLSSETVDRVLERSDADDLEQLEADLGRSIDVEDDVPADTVLYLSPESIDADGAVVDPSAIACGLIGQSREMGS